MVVPSETELMKKMIDSGGEQINITHNVSSVVKYYMEIIT